MEHRFRLSLNLMTSILDYVHLNISSHMENSMGGHTKLNFDCKYDIGLSDEDHEFMKIWSMQIFHLLLLFFKLKTYHCNLSFSRKNGFNFDDV